MISKETREQIQLLLWKRKIEYFRAPWDIAKVLVPPMLFVLLMVILYQAYPSMFNTGVMEEYFLPLSVWLFIQRLVITITYEKSAKLVESMKMMGLKESNYWFSYFISEGIIAGFVVSFITALISLGGVMGEVGENFQSFIFYWSFYLSSVTFSFFLASCFDKPQTAGQASILVLLGTYVTYLGLYNEINDNQSMQRGLCLIPPLAFQIGAGSQKGSSNAIPIMEIVGWQLLTIPIYGALAWYTQQVRPSEYGIQKPFYFILDYRYWFDLEIGTNNAMKTELTSPLVSESQIEKEKIPIEAINEKVTGKATVVIKGLMKSFGSQTAVNNLSFNMYSNQIFCLLGHNGAGKTTTINMLTGLMPMDNGSGSADTAVYGCKISDDMDHVRKVMGVCPQHDVLFELLSVKEHIIFFSRLKGSTLYDTNKDTEVLTNKFHLEERLDNLANELSGGQRRKLSVAIAVCGGSKFIVLDEPTAGMDPLARRELWDLLAELRIGRTMLLTTHYMDEADVLGDRVGIMSLGQLQCLGSTEFLKKRFGAGYKLTLNLVNSKKSRSKTNLTQLTNTNTNEESLESAQAAFADKYRPLIVNKVTSFVKGAHIDEDETSTSQVVMVLPFDEVGSFSKLFLQLDDEKQRHDIGIDNFGVNITSLEDVFIKVGGDHTVVPTTTAGIQGERKYSSTLTTQTFGIIYRRLAYGRNDFVTQCMIIFPLLVVFVSAILYEEQVISTDTFTKNIVALIMYIFAFLMVPGLLAEFLIKERVTKLRTVLTVSGCDFRAYWLGSFIADFALLSIIAVGCMISWHAIGASDFYDEPETYFLLIFFNTHTIGFGYLCSYIFGDPKSSIFVTPSIILGLLMVPNIILGLVQLLFDQGLGLFSIAASDFGGIALWMMALLTPHGTFLVGMLDASYDISSFINHTPPSWACVIIQLIQTAIFCYIACYADSTAVQEIQEQAFGEDFIDVNAQQLIQKSEYKNPLNTHELESRDIESGESKIKSAMLRLGMDNDEDPPRDDVIDELHDVMSCDVSKVPLVIKGLRKVFPPKRLKQKNIVASAGVFMSVREGEIFGLLGANGAGKTTTLSMLTRHLVPTAGVAYIKGQSILSDFTKAAVNLGVVTQDNSLWPLLSVTGHLKLFARLRGVPEDSIDNLVDAVIDQLELSPHRYKLAGRLSGGMKRKLCVAIALIGDPAVCLLDEPSAGLDPVSKRNLWNVILRTMSHRSVVLTTHSMEEAEALCQRIAIMVKGQVRAVGTKQHLKSTLGAGYELIIKLAPDTANLRKTSQRIYSNRIASLNRISQSSNNSDLDIIDKDNTAAATVSGTELSPMNSINSNEDQERHSIVSDQSLQEEETSKFDTKLKEFISKLFENSEIVADNGGLITWRIAPEKLSLGVVFRELEANKVDLRIESYSISQPTLEQVFMRTVQSYDDYSKVGGKISDVAGLDRRSLSLRSDPHTSNRSMSEQLQDANADRDEEEFEIDPSMLPKNPCGCTLSQTRYRVIYALAFFIISNLIFVFAIIPNGSANAVALFNVLTLGALITFVVMMWIWQCSCCKVRGVDDDN